MKIKNTSTKIVHIGTTTILPDEVGTVDDSLKSAPVVSAFIERGDIQIVTGKGAGKAGKGGKKAPATRGIPRILRAATATGTALRTAARAIRTAARAIRTASKEVSIWHSLTR